MWSESWVQAVRGLVERDGEGFPDVLAVLPGCPDGFVKSLGVGLA